MKYTAMLPLLGAAALAAMGCYRFAYVTTVLESPRGWTGTGTVSISDARKRSVGLAGQDIVVFDREDHPRTLVDPALREFGGPHVLTSLVQTHNMGLHEHTFLHGNLRGRTDNLDLFYQSDESLVGWLRVRPSGTRISDGNTLFNIVQICSLAAAGRPEYGHPTDPSSHLFMSFRACPEGGGACAGGVLEAQFDNLVRLWSVRSNGTGTQVRMRRADGSRFPNQCMPLSVTGYGDQAKQYLALGDPAADEISIFDASRLWAGPLSAVRAPDPSRSIKDVVVEGRGDSGIDFVFLAVLWRGTAGASVEHTVVTNGKAATAPHLIETVPSDVLFIEGRGGGAEGTSADLFTYGARVVRRTYQQ